MLKFQTPMSNDEVCRAMTDKHTNTQTHKHTNKKHTYWVKTEETFFLPPSFLFSIFISLIVWTLKKAVSKKKVDAARFLDARGDEKQVIYLERPNSPRCGSWICLHSCCLFIWPHSSRICTASLTCLSRTSPPNTLNTSILNLGLSSSPHPHGAAG